MEIRKSESDIFLFKILIHKYFCNLHNIFKAVRLASFFLTLVHLIPSRLDRSEIQYTVQVGLP